MLFNRLSLVTLAIAVSLSAANAAENPVSSESANEITGAGAHFSWVIFNDLKDGLEHKSGRKIRLYGQQSMLGMGCNAGIKTAKQNRPGNETFGFVCCALSDDELKKEGIRLYPIAREPILILVHKSNPVENVSLANLRAMFRGKITNWKEVGGPDRPIVVITRLHCKHRPGHWKTILKDEKQFRKERLNVKSAAEMVKTVSDFPGALGHTGATWVFDHQSNAKSIRIDNVAPTAANLKSGKYPFYRQLGAVTNQRPSPAVMSVIKHVQTGPEFREVARKYNLVPLK